MLALATTALAEAFRGQEAVATFDVEAEPRLIIFCDDSLGKLSDSK
jgi:hypothetical protein